MVYDGAAALERREKGSAMKPPPPHWSWSPAWGREECMPEFVQAHTREWIDHFARQGHDATPPLAKTSGP